jgi:hypothetical protein
MKTTEFLLQAAIANQAALLSSGSQEAARTAWQGAEMLLAEMPPALREQEPPQQPPRLRRALRNLLEFAKQQGWANHTEDAQRALETPDDELNADDILAWADGIHAALGTEYAARVTDQEATLATAILQAQVPTVPHTRLILAVLAGQTVQYRPPESPHWLTYLVPKDAIADMLDDVRGEEYEYRLKRED